MNEQNTKIKNIGFRGECWLDDGLKGLKKEDVNISKSTLIYHLLLYTLRDFFVKKSGGDKVRFINIVEFIIKENEDEDNKNKLKNAFEKMKGGSK